MQETWLDIIESKKTWYALLTAIAAIAGIWGFKFDAAGTLLIMTPFGLLLGAQGWADSGPGGAIVAQARQVRRMARLERTNPAEHTRRVAAMKLLSVALVLLAFGCSSAQRANGLTCAEGTLSVAQLAEVAGDLANDNYDDLLNNLVAKEGFALVKCGIETIFATRAEPPAGSGATVQARPDPVRVHASAWLEAHGGAK